MNEITIEESDKQIFAFDVLYSGWECDYRAWVYEKPNGTRYLAMTNHGNIYVAPRKHLEDKIKEYKQVIEDTEKAIALIPK
jgi:hypothetical protein